MALVMIERTVKQKLEGLARLPQTSYHEMTSEDALVVKIRATHLSKSIPQLINDDWDTFIHNIPAMIVAGSPI